MSKLKKFSLLVFTVIILLGIFVLHQVVNPSLSSIEANEKNEAGIYISPDGAKRITVYFNGGLILHNDTTYVGVLEDFNSGLKKNIFLVMPTVKEVRWINNGAIVVNGTEITMDDTYDFRNE